MSGFCGLVRCPGCFGFCNKSIPRDKMWFTPLPQIIARDCTISRSTASSSQGMASANSSEDFNRKQLQTYERGVEEGAYLDPVFWKRKLGQS
jgi:hypothetical protein